jgi:RNA polymerase sigma-70 factor, ECF subfamily
MVTRVIDEANILKAGYCLPEESGLVTRLQAGESEAIREIFQANFDRLYTFIYHNVGWDQTVTEDIVQDTFLAAIKTARSFKGDSHVYTWLAAIAHHKISDYYRKLKRERARFDRFQDNYSCDMEVATANEKSAEKFVETTEAKVLVGQALQGLPNDYRQVLLLKYIEEMTVADIGRVMQRSSKSVEGLLSRARKALREILDNN